MVFSGISEWFYIVYGKLILKGVKINFFNNIVNYRNGR